MHMPLAHLSIRDLHAVLALAREKHFGRTAEACHVTQPTLSAQVKKVEKALGAHLFERGRRRFLITPAGERILPMIQAVVDRVDELAANAAAEGGDPLTGEFRLGAITTLGPFYIPRFLAQLRQERPGLELHLAERLTDDLLGLVKNGELDAALVSTIAPTPGIEFVPLFREPFLLLAPAGHPLTSAHSLDPKDLRAPEMVLLDEGHCLRDQALDLCDPRYGRSPRIMATSIETLRHLVAIGSGYTLLPRLAVRSDPVLDTMLVCREFEQGSPSRLIGLAYRSGAGCEASVLELARLLKSWLPEEVIPA